MAKILTRRIAGGCENAQNRVCGLGPTSGKLMFLVQRNGYKLEARRELSRLVSLSLTTTM